MPVLINNQTQLAENLPQEEADLALQKGTHEIPLNDPQGNPVTADLQSAKQLLQSGYRSPNVTQIQNLMDYAHYSSSGEQAKTALEGAAAGATFGASTGVERVLGANPEDIQARREVNPNAYLAGETAGIVGSSLFGTGEGALVEKAGQTAIKALGIEAPQRFLAKVGSAAAKNAVETALISSGDEVSKMLASDPNQSAETAMASIGLNALLGAQIGGAFGVAPALWKAASETKVGQFLDTITKKANGLGKETLPSPEIQNALQTTGIEIPNEMKAALSDNPEARGMFQALQESTTRAGKEAQQSFDLFKKKNNEAIVSALGKSPEDLDSLLAQSDHELGSELKNSLMNQIQSRMDPLTQKFEKIKNQFSQAEISPEEISGIGNQISKMAQDQGYGILEGTSQGNLVNKVLNSLPNVKNLEDLRKLQSQVYEQTQNPEMWGIGKNLKNILRETEESAVESKLTQESPQLLAEHQLARDNYRDAMSSIDQLNDRLRVGKYSGPSSFLKNLKEMNPEDLLKRITPKNDVNFLDLLNQKFPETGKQVQQTFLNQVLKQAAMKSEPGSLINSKTLFNLMDRWSPELKQFSLSEATQNQLQAIQTLLEKIPSKMNPSGTAKTLDALWSHVPGGVGSMVGLLSGHNPVLSYFMGQLTHSLGREIPDAVKLSALKFLGSDLPVSASGFRAMAEFISHSQESTRMIQNGVKNIFKTGAQVFPQSLEPKENQRERLKKRLDEVSTNPEELLKVGGDTPYYLPEHGISFGAIAGRAVQYLNSLKPNETKTGILDPKPIPSEVEKIRFNRALDIAHQPLLVLKHIQKGTISNEDVQALKAMYPAFYTHLSQKLIHSIIDQQAKKQNIPYSTRIGLSIFLGQPLDSSMSAFSIQNTQPQIPSALPASPAPKSSSHGSLKALNSLSGIYLTKAQAREKTRTEGHA